MSEHFEVVTNRCSHTQLENVTSETPKDSLSQWNTTGHRIEYTMTNPGGNVTVVPLVPVVVSLNTDLSD